MYKNKLKNWINQEVEDSVINFTRFIKGCYCFALGLMIIIWIDRLVEPSAQAEIMTLMGLMVMVFGILLALRGYMSFSLFKILRYFFKD